VVCAIVLFGVIVVHNVRGRACVRAYYVDLVAKEHVMVNGRRVDVTLLDETVRKGQRNDNRRFDSVCFTGGLNFDGRFILSVTSKFWLAEVMSFMIDGQPYPVCSGYVTEPHRWWSEVLPHRTIVIGLLDNGCFLYDASDLNDDDNRIGDEMLRNKTRYIPVHTVLDDGEAKSELAARLCRDKDVVVCISSKETVKHSRVLDLLSVCSSLKVRFTFLRYWGGEFGPYWVDEKAKAKSGAGREPLETGEPGNASL